MATSQARLPLKIQFGSSEVCFMVAAILRFQFALKLEGSTLGWRRVSVACSSSCPPAGKTTASQLYEHFNLK